MSIWSHALIVVDIMSMKVFVWILGHLFTWAVDPNGGILDSHLFFYDRYSDLADYHRLRGRTAKADRLTAIAQAYYQAAPDDDDEPEAAAIAMAMPRPPIRTNAVSTTRVPKPRGDESSGLAPRMRFAGASSLVFACAFQFTDLAQPLQQPKLSLTVERGASLTGRVVPEPAGALTTPIGLRVTANKAHEPLAGGMSIAAAVHADWSFRMTGLSGSYEFLVSSDRPPPMVVATRIVVDGTSYAMRAPITFTEGDHDVVLFVAPREAPKPTIDATQNSSALIQQFKNEKVFWKQFEIGKTIAGKRDPSALPPLADWLGHADRHIRGNVAFIFASLGDPRGLQTIADILADRSERPEGQGIPTAPSDGRYRFQRQVAADRYYAAHLLGDLRDPRGVALLVPLLGDSETQSVVPWSLGQIGDKRAIPPLIAALDNDDPSNRVLVIYALEALDAKEAIPRLMTLVNDDRKSRFGALVPVSEAAKAAIAKLR